MPWILEKASSPGWSEPKVFDRERDALEYLARRHICAACLDDVGQDPMSVLGTACGCEFWLTEEDSLQAYDGDA